MAANRYEEKAKPKEVKKPVEEASAPVVPVDVDVAAEAKQLAAGCADLDALRATIEMFEGCALKRGARNTVFSDGNLQRV